MLLSWTSLNPADLVARMTSTFSKFYDFKTFEDFMKRVSTTCLLTLPTSLRLGRSEGKKIEQIHSLFACLRI